MTELSQNNQMVRKEQLYKKKKKQRTRAESENEEESTAANAKNSTNQFAKQHTYKLIHKSMEMLLLAHTKLYSRRNKQLSARKREKRE